MSDNQIVIKDLSKVYDNDFNANHQRGSIGLEAKGAYLDFTMNNYIALSNPTIFKNNKDVFTVSFHGEKNYPFRKEKSDYDYGFSDGVSDKYYLSKIKYEIPKLIEDFEPDFIFYLSGVDIIENDKLGRLSVSINGCKERDNYVLNFCKTNSIPIQVSMGGGYSPILKDIIEAHANTFRLAQEIYF